ncbi:MAG: dephospho-CoA kinase [Burkholderiaceae bacterium]
MSAPTPSPDASHPNAATGPASGPFLVGLTGGIGSGKTTVAKRFEALGVTVVDTDAIAHELTGPGGAAMPAIRAAFGDGVVAADGRLDRAAMRERVFADPAERKRLEAILHPMIGETTNARALAATSAYVILAIPLLVEGGRWGERVHRVLVIDCAEQTQVERVMQRSGLSADQVRDIMAAQASRAERLAAASDVIDNDGTPEALDAPVAALHARYLGFAAAHAARRS